MQKDYSQCPPLGRPPPITYLNGISMILIMHPTTVITSRHTLYYYLVVVQKEIEEEVHQMVNMTLRWKKRYL